MVAKDVSFLGNWSAKEDSNIPESRASLGFHPFYSNELSGAADFYEINLSEPDVRRGKTTHRCCFLSSVTLYYHLVVGFCGFIHSSSYQT